ncbi:hypothetical protein AB205_0176830 [Aquarana catesbeiana]|uniref:Uncharacterized protein n=1 Tax=Aquarana catesbeiana TaxID=8400 RepID=A0A2G9RGH4_AQUCT|nr:hypothetical protein AB205_0176830 [Aquarana catesbeiana]
MGIDGLKFGWCSSDRLNCDPSVATAVDQNSIYRLTSVQLSCQIKAIRSVASAPICVF